MRSPGAIIFESVRDLVDDAEIVLGQHGDERLGRRIVQQQLVGKIVEDRNQPVLPPRFARRNLVQRPPPLVRQNRARRIVHRHHVEERNLLRRRPQLAQLALEQLHVHALRVLGHRKNLESLALQHICVNVIGRVRGHHDPRRQHLRQSVQNAGRAACANRQPIARDRRLVQLPYLHRGQEAANRPDQVCRAHRRAVVERLPVLHAVASNRLQRLHQLGHGNGFLVDVANP